MTTPSIDPIKAESKIAEAKSILRALGLPEAQQRDLSALILLSLLDMTTEAKWSKAAAPNQPTEKVTARDFLVRTGYSRLSRTAI